MNYHKDQRKKALRMLLALFLVAGGIIFAVSMFRGLGDLKDMDRSNFSYGFAARNAALPLFQYFGLSDEHEPRAAGTRPRLASILPYKPQADISSWMAKDGAGSASPAAGAPGSGGNSAAGGPAQNTKIPQMAASASGLGGLGGGSSQSSAGAPKPSAAAGPQKVAEMSKPQVSGEIKLSAAGRQILPAGAPAGSKLMNALSAVKGAMLNSVKSNSAMEASTEWNRAFGANSAKSGSVKEMAYAGGSGLSQLDGIKGGISDLKTSDINSLKSVSPPSPTKDKESEKNDDFLNMMKGLGGAGSGGQAKKNAEEATNELKNQNAKDPMTGKPIEAVPQEVIDKAYTPVSEGGLFCGSGQCQTEKGQILDKEVKVTPVGDGVNYKFDYIGTQSDYKGTTVDYTDSLIYNSQTQTYAPAGSKANCNGGEKQDVQQGGAPPGCPIEK